MHDQTRPPGKKIRSWKKASKRFYYVCVFFYGFFYWPVSLFYSNGFFFFLYKSMLSEGDYYYCLLTNNFINLCYINYVSIFKWHPFGLVKWSVAHPIFKAKAMQVFNVFISKWLNESRPVIGCLVCVKWYVFVANHHSGLKSVKCEPIFILIN